MCLAVPMKIEAIEGSVAAVSYAGAEYPVRIDLVDAGVGDYVLVHAGVAVAKVDEAEALKILELFKEIDELSASVPRPGDDTEPGGGDQA